MSTDRSAVARETAPGAAPAATPRIALRLLGSPEIRGVDGPRELGGHKTWALLAILALAARPVARRELSERLWSGADDPLAALRWALLQVRRAIEPDFEILDTDGRLALRPIPPATIDVVTLLDGRFRVDEVEDLVSGALLEGLDVADAPEFEHWLTLERARVSTAASAAARFAAVNLSATDPDRAISLVQRALALDGFDDAAHELAISILVETGRRTAATTYLRSVTARYRDELGIEPPAMLRRPLERPAPGSVRSTRAAPGRVDPAVAPSATARALLQSAQARLAAGDYSAAIEVARRASELAAGVGDPAIEADALLTLASTLIHTIRGHDHEAVGLLDRALTLAIRLGDERLTADVEWEIGWVAFLEARYGAAESTMRRVIATAVTMGNPRLAGRAATVLGAAQSDRGEFEAAEATLDGAIADLAGAGDRFVAFARSFLARVLLRTGRVEGAREMAMLAVATARETGWASLVPWTLAVEGEAALLAGDDRAPAILEECYALACEVGDPCWEAFGLRGLALVAWKLGDVERADDLLAEAVRRSVSLPDIYAWARALVATDLAELRHGTDETVLEQARSLAGRGPMTDLAARLDALTPTR